MVELTKFETESRTVRSAAMGLLQLGKVNVKPTANQFRGSGMSCIVGSPHVEHIHVGTLSLTRRKFARVRFRPYRWTRRKILKGHFVSQTCFFMLRGSSSKL